MAEAPDRMRFLAVEDSRVARWAPPSRYDFLDRLRTAPVADSELLHLSHYCPIVVTMQEDRPLVVALLDPAMTLSHPVGDDGAWRRPYAPIALRNLPFWPGSGKSGIAFAPELAGDPGEGGYALKDNAGRPTDQFAAVMTWIERLRAGMNRLSVAAKLLIAADILAPLGVARAGSPHRERTEYFTACPRRVNALPPARAAALSGDGCLPLDIVAACLFSQRLLARAVAILGDGHGGARVEKRVEPAPDDLLAPDLSLRLDSSPLFSFDGASRDDFRPAGENAAAHA